MCLCITLHCNNNLICRGCEGPIRFGENQDRVSLGCGKPFVDIKVESPSYQLGCRAATVPPKQQLAEHVLSIEQNHFHKQMSHPVHFWVSFSPNLNGIPASCVCVDRGGGSLALFLSFCSVVETITVSIFPAWSLYVNVGDDSRRLYEVPAKIAT